MDLSEHIEALIAYCEMWDLTYVDRECSRLMDDEGWAGAVASAFDPRYIDEMTPIIPVMLYRDGTFVVITGEDATGDVFQEFTLGDVLCSIREGKPLHWVHD